MDSQLPPLSDPLTWLSFAILGSLTGLAQAGGIGGGPIVTPVMMALFGISSKQAVWYAYLMLFGGSIGNFLRLGKERTSDGSTPLINYQLVMITLPLLLSGAILGVAAGKWLPKIIIVICLFGILLSVFIKTRKSLIKLKNSENNEQLIQHELKEIKINNDEGNIQGLLSLIQEKESRLYPKDILLEMALSVSVVLFINLLKGSNTIPSLLGLDFCGYGYHFLNFVIFAAAFYNIQRYKKLIIKEENDKEKAGYEFPDGKMSSVFALTVRASLLAGFLGGLVGLGGGTVLTPLWLETGINPRRATASATFTVFFTSSMSVFMIVISGGYSFEQFLIFTIVSGVGSYLVAGFLKSLVQKYRRESILIQVLLGVVLFGLLVLPVQSFKDIYHNPIESIQFTRLC